MVPTEQGPGNLPIRGRPSRVGNVTNARWERLRSRTLAAAPPSGNPKRTECDKDPRCTAAAGGRTPAGDVVGISTIVDAGVFTGARISCAGIGRCASPAGAERDVRALEVDVVAVAVGRLVVHH